MRMMPLFVTVNREVLYAPPPCEMGLIMLRHQTRTFGFGRMRRRRRHLTVIAPWAMATGIQSAGRSMGKKEPPACQDQILARVGLRRRRANVKAAPRENGGRTKRDTGNAIAILGPVCLSVSVGRMPVGQECEFELPPPPHLPAMKEEKSKRRREGEDKSASFR